MKIKNLVILSFSLLLIIYCASTTVSRFKSTKSKGKNDSLVDIRLFSTRIEPAQAGIKNILLLGDHAQARFIEILHQKYSDDDEKFQDALKRDWFGDDGELKADYINKDLKMVFSISQKKTMTLTALVKKMSNSHQLTESNT